jgi:hypothetical protein
MALPLAVKVTSVAKGAKKAAPGVKRGAKKINDDTKGALSWLAVGGIAVFGFIVLKTINNASKVGDAVGEVVGGAGDTIAAGFKLTNSVLGEAVKIVKDPNNDASGVMIKGNVINTSITEIQALNRAVLLLEAMDRPATNLDRVVLALSNINTADFVLIAEKFGTPRRNDTFGIKSIYPSPKRNMMYWIANELDDNEMVQLKNAFPELY